MKLKILRKKANLSQSAVAKIVGITQRAYASYELEQSQPSAETLSVLADFYHTTVDDLLDRQSKDLINLNLVSNEERKIIENLRVLNKDNLLKVEAYTDFCLQSQKNKAE